MTARGDAQRPRLATEAPQTPAPPGRRAARLLPLLLAIVMFVRAVLRAGQPDAVRAEIIRINTDTRPLALQIALVVPVLAGLAGLGNSSRMAALPDPTPSGSGDGLLMGVIRTVRPRGDDGAHSDPTGSAGCRLTAAPDRRAHARGHPARRARRRNPHEHHARRPGAAGRAGRVAHDPAGRPR